MCISARMKRNTSILDVLNYDRFYQVSFINFPGGVALIRAAAKNHERVAVICDSADYETVINEIINSASSDVSLDTKLVLFILDKKTIIHILT